MRRRAPVLYSTIPSLEERGRKGKGKKRERGKTFRWDAAKFFSYIRRKVGKKGKGKGEEEKGTDMTPRGVSVNIPEKEKRRGRRRGKKKKREKVILLNGAPNTINT